METVSVTALDIVTSTSDHLLDAIKNNAPEGTAIRANVQTKGRGRRGRDWVSPRGNLYVSVLLRPTRAMAEWPSLSLVAGLALFDALRVFRPKNELGLKWPNDVLYQERKCAGLLLEVADGAIMLGCGVNLNASPDTVTGWPPISINDDADHANVDADSLMAQFSTTLCARYNTWCADGFMGLRDNWLEAAAHHGHMLTINRQHDVIEGRFDDIDEAGSLCLIDGDGVKHVLAQGDVTRARLHDDNNSLSKAKAGVNNAVSD